MKSSLEAKQFNYLMHVAKPSSHVLGNLLQTKILEKLYKLSGLASPDKTYPQSFLLQGLWYMPFLSGLALKNPTLKNPPNKTPKKHLKKPQPSFFFLGGGFY